MTKPEDTPRPIEILMRKVADLTGFKSKTQKGKAHEFPPHAHDAATHRHGHSHVMHYRKPAERDEWIHVTATHEHLHNHAQVSHMHMPHEDLGLEHVHEGHVHDHDHPAVS